MSGDISMSKIEGEDKKCELCNSRKSMYTCPRCAVQYCSVDCYKSEDHLECSESFYQQCVINELKSQEHDPEQKRKMMDILKRIHEEDQMDFFEDINSFEDELDSDDDDNIPDLSSRLENVNLDNADEVWAALTDAEKQEFQALVRNGEAEKLLPHWIPWWEHRIEKKLVEDLSAKKDNADPLNECPFIVEVPTFHELSKASPNVSANLINVLYAYAYVALYYNGDYMNCATEACSTFFDICENIKNNAVFVDSKSAIESVLQRIENCERLPKDEEMMVKLQEAGKSIIQGPEKESCLYISAALSELHRLSEAAKKEVIEDKQAGKKSEQFSHQFGGVDATHTVLHKRKLLLCMKKLEYYLSWVNRYGTSLCKEFNE